MRGLEAPQRLGRRRAALGDRHRRPGEHAPHDDAEPADVPQRQVEQPAVAGAEPEPLGDASRARDVVSDRVQDGLRRTRRARRVDDGPRRVQMDGAGQAGPDVRRGHLGEPCAPDIRSHRNARVGDDEPDAETGDGVVQRHGRPPRRERRHDDSRAERREQKHDEVWLRPCDDADDRRLKSRLVSTDFPSVILSGASLSERSRRISAERFACTEAPCSVEIPRQARDDAVGVCSPPPAEE